MSTRWYPIFQKGGPQLRVFLPNFWMKLIRPTEEQPSNVVQFACSMEMTKFDIKNYLEKIYNVKCAHVRTRVYMPKTRRDPLRGYVIKDDDVKLAYVILHKDEKFVFPNIFPEKKDRDQQDLEKSLVEAKKGYQEYLKKNKDRVNMPGWFTV